MQLLFSFGQGARVKKTLMQTPASQLSTLNSHATFVLVYRGISTLINSHATLVLVWPCRSWELRKLWCKLSVLNSHQLSWNSCSRLTGAWELRKLSYKLSLLNSHQLSSNSCSRLTGPWELRKLSCKLSLLNSHATLVLVWPGHESWENSDANSRFSTLMQLLFSFDQGMRVEKTLMQTLAPEHYGINLHMFFTVNNWSLWYSTIFDNSFSWTRHCSMQFHMGYFRPNYTHISSIFRGVSYNISSGNNLMWW